MHRLTITEENGVKIYHYDFGMVSDGGKGFYEIFSNYPLPEEEIRKTELECDEILGNLSNNLADEINKQILNRIKCRRDKQTKKYRKGWIFNR